MEVLTRTFEEELGQKDGCGSQTQLRGVALKWGAIITWRY